MKILWSNIITMTLTLIVVTQGLQLLGCPIGSFMYYVGCFSTGCVFGILDIHLIEEVKKDGDKK